MALLSTFMAPLIIQARAISRIKRMGQQVYIGRTGYLNLAGKTLTMNSSGGNLVNEGFIYAGSLKANNGQMCINNSGCTQFDNIEVNDVSSYIVNDNGSGYVNFTKSGSNPGVNQNLTSSSTLNVCSKVATTWNRWNNAAVSYGCTTPNWSCGNPLAISLSFFKVERSESAARVRWGTNLEKNTDYFIIERSNNGSQWEEIGQVKSLGRTSVYSEYSLLDNSPFYGANYYRLTEVEVTGKKTVYAVSLLMISSANLSFYLYPNPSNGNFSVFVGSEFEAYDFEIKDMMGKSYGHYGLHAGKNDLENAVPQGTYFAQLKVGPDRKIQRFIVQ